VLLVWVAGDSDLCSDLATLVVDGSRFSTTKAQSTQSIGAIRSGSGGIR
jgi:hypothetical protein